MSGSSCSDELLQRAFRGRLAPKDVRELVRMELEPEDVRRLERAFLMPGADVVSYCRVFERHNTPCTLKVLEKKGQRLLRTKAALAFIYERPDVFRHVYETNRLKALSGISAALYYGHKVTPERLALFDGFVRPLLAGYIRARLASLSIITRDRQAMELVPLAALWPNLPEGVWYVERAYGQAACQYHVKDWLIRIMLRMETERFPLKLKRLIVEDVAICPDVPVVLTLALRFVECPGRFLLDELDKLYWTTSGKSDALRAMEECGDLQTAEALTRALMRRRDAEMARTLLRLSWKHESTEYALFALLSGARPDDSMKPDTSVRQYITRLAKAL